MHAFTDCIRLWIFTGGTDIANVQYLKEVGEGVACEFPTIVMYDAHWPGVPCEPCLFKFSSDVVAGLGGDSCKFTKIGCGINTCEGEEFAYKVFCFCLPRSDEVDGHFVPWSHEDIPVGE